MNDEHVWSQDTKETDSFGKFAVFQYDAVGNMIQTADRSGRSRAFSYDNLNRPTQETWLTAGTEEHWIYWGYDIAGRLDEVSELHGPQAVSPEVEYSYTYDDLNRLTSVTDTAARAAFQFADSGSTGVPSAEPVRLDYTYNASGDLASAAATLRTDQPGGGDADYINHYSYFSDGKLHTVVQEGTAAAGQPAIARKAVGFSWYLDGRLAQLERVVGATGADVEVATTTYDYFNYGGLQQINHTHSGHTVGTTPPPATQLNSYDYTYDDNGRITSIESNDGTRLYQYDNTGQLIGVTDGAASLESYDYDATGNRTSQTVNGASNTTVVTRNRLMSDGTYSYTYDDEGNTTQKVTIATGDYQTYTWDHRNRMIQVEFKDSTDALEKTVRYTYDAFDRRVLTEVDANSDGVFEDFQRSVWDGSHVSLVLDETSTVEHRFLHGPMVDMVLADESATDGLLWYLTDHQNTVRDVIDNTGAVLNHIDYTSFGEILTETDDTYTPYFAYTGRELDQHTGLQYNRARWYDPRTGRWLSEDPIRWAAGDVNLQRYVGNGSLNKTDPSGLEETVWTQQGQVAHFAIQEAILAANQSADKEIETKRHGVDEGRYDARRGNQKIEIGAATPTGVNSKLKDIDSLKGTNKNLFLYESRGQVPVTGDTLNYAELTPSQARLLQKEIKENKWTLADRAKIFARAKELGRSKSTKVSTRAAACAGKTIHRRGKLVKQPTRRPPGLRRGMMRAESGGALAIAAGMGVSYYMSHWAQQEDCPQWVKSMEERAVAHEEFIESIEEKARNSNQPWYEQLYWGFVLVELTNEDGL